MNGEYKRNFVNVAAVHIVAVVFLLLATGFRTVFGKKPEQAPILEFVVNVTQDEPRLSSLPDIGLQPEPERESRDIPEVAPKPEKKRTPKEIVKPKPEKKKIQVSRKKIIRTAGKSAKPEKRLTREEIERLLRMGAKPSDHTSIPPDEDARCYSLIHEAFHEAWTQPSREEVGTDVYAEASIRLLWDGTVGDRRLSRQSGNPILDASVMQALKSVRRIEGVTRDFARQHETVTIAFRLED